MTDTSETLAHRIRRVQDETGVVNPRELAELVLKTLDSPALVQAALVEALPDFVRITMHPHSRPALRVGPPRSAKCDRIAEYDARRHAELLAQPVDVSGNRGRQWKTLGECTRTDLFALVLHRRELAVRNLAKADQYEQLMSMLRPDQPDQKVADLPADRVDSVFFGERVAS